MFFKVMQELSLNDFLNLAPQKQKKGGFVAIIGRPNVGKSTFINTLIGEKISIVSSTPQTTRKKVLWIYNDEDVQIIFIDTPWIHFSEKAFNQEINTVAKSSLESAQVILYFIDTSRPYGEEEKQIEDFLWEIKTPIIKVFTKHDISLSSFQKEEGFFISSFQKEGFQPLLEKISSYLEVWPLLYPEEFYTNQDIYFRISEIIREKVFLETKEEVPHSVYISVEEVQEEEKLYKIIAYIICETDSQKYILIGKSGDLIKKMATQARLDLEKVLGKKVFLALRVKVQKNWRKNEKIVRDLLT